MAGGGVEAGTAYDESDELGHKAVVNRADVHDFQATLLYLRGLEHEKLTLAAQRPPLPADRREGPGNSRADWVRIRARVSGFRARKS
jgi:hypothetical protein